MIHSLKRLYQYLTAWRYTIGFAEYSDDIVLKDDYFPKINWIKGVPRNRWFADPFILSTTETEYEVLVENYSYKEHKAKISIITVDRTSYKLKSISDLIESSYHMSFPAFFIEGNRLFIYPEKCKSGELTLFEYDLTSKKLFKQTTILHQPIADAVILNTEVNSLIIGTLFPRDNGNKLYIFPLINSAPNPQVTPIQIYKFRDNTARNAGQYFYVKQQLYRPAQCCNKRYGECLVFQKISNTDKGDLIFEEVKRVHSPSKRYNLSFHTFNVYNSSVVVVDASGYRFRIIGALLESFRNIIKR